MAEITKKNLVLGFTTPAGKEVSLTIKEPAEGLESAQVSAVMDEIIATNAFGDTETVSAKESAKYVIQEIEQISLA